MSNQVAKSWQQVTYKITKPSRDIPLRLTSSDAFRKSREKAISKSQFRVHKIKLSLLTAKIGLSRTLGTRLEQSRPYSRK